MLGVFAEFERGIIESGSMLVSRVQERMKRNSGGVASSLLFGQREFLNSLGLEQSESNVRRGVNKRAGESLHRI
jgi:hypothetical protein